MKKNRKTGRRDGSGMIIIVAITTMLILALLFFAQSRLTSQCKREAHFLATGDMAEILADSAIEEAMAVVRKGANDPASPLYETLRKLVYAPATGEAVLLTNHAFHHAKTLTRDIGEGRITLEDLEVRIAMQKQLDATAYERRGVIRYRACARVRRLLGRSILRRVERVQDFKVALAGVPLPHCSYGLFVAHMDGLVDGSEVNGKLRQLKTSIKNLRQSVTSAKEIVPAAFAEKYTDLAAGMLKDEALDRAKPLPENGAAALYGLIRRGVRLRFGSLDLAARLGKAEARARELHGQAATARDKLRAAPSDGKLYDEFITAVRTHEAALRKGLWDAWAFTRTFRILPSTHQAYGKLSRSYYKFYPAYWKRRAQYRVALRAGEKDINTAWARFRKDMPHARGVILFENPKTSLTLTGSLPGATALVVGSGGVRIEDFNADGGPDDATTVVSLGGPVTVHGEAHCALVLARSDETPHRLEINADSTLVGALSIYRLPRDMKLAGTLVRSGKVLSGRRIGKGPVWIDPKRLHVAMAPRCLYRKVARQ